MVKKTGSKKKNMGLPDVNNGLLPNGMMDMLPPYAGIESEAIRKLLDVFSGFGYREVKPPIAEFEESLLGDGVSSALVHNTFRLMDPVSHRMMGIRSDTTMQIARIAASRLNDVPRPLRLSYAADVLRVKSSQLRPERQFVQVGCELIGPDHIEASAEIALLAVLSLHRIGVRYITIDFNIPELVSLVVGVQKEAMAGVIERRERDALKGFGVTGKLIQGLMDAAGESRSSIKALKKLSLPPKAKQSIQRVESVVEMVRCGLQSYGIEKDVAITIDPIESRGFEYQTGPSFTLFAKSTKAGELGRGGHYSAAFAIDQDRLHRETANGFTLYMDSILSILPAVDPPHCVWVPVDTSWHEMRELQENGWRVVRGESLKADAAYLRASSVSHVFKNGKIKKI